MKDVRIWTGFVIRERWQALVNMVMNLPDS
jgi:hypothetical protein